LLAGKIHTSKFTVCLTLKVKIHNFLAQTYIFFMRVKF